MPGCWATEIGAAGAPPMFRAWHWSAQDARRLRALSTEGVVPSLEASRILLGERDSLKLLDASDGGLRWTARLGSPAAWVGYLDDRLIAAGPRQVVALDLATGNVLWRYRPGGEPDGEARPDPFAAADETTDGPARRSRRDLHGFRVVKGHVFCLRGDGELIALDGDTGATDWSFASPPGEINANLWIGAERIVLQVNRPNQILVLRTEDGQPIARTPLGDADLLDRPPLPLDDDSVLVVLDVLTVKKLDLGTGQFVWEYRESDVPPVNGPPRLMGDGELVLVLHDGRTLIRLDPATGSKRWSCPLGLEDMSQNPASMAFDDGRFYCISRFSSTVTLRAISLADGTPSWTTSWHGDEDKWSLALTNDHVFCYSQRGGTGRPDRSRLDHGAGPPSRRWRAGAADALPDRTDGTRRSEGPAGAGAGDGTRSPSRDLQPRPPGRGGGDATGRMGPRRPRGRGAILAAGRRQAAIGRMARQRMFSGFVRIESRQSGGQCPPARALDRRSMPTRRGTAGRRPASFPALVQEQPASGGTA